MMYLMHITAHPLRFYPVVWGWGLGRALLVLLFGLLIMFVLLALFSQDSSSSSESKRTESSPNPTIDKS